MDKTPGKIFFLKIANSLSFPDTQGPGTIFLPDMLNLLGYFVKSLVTGNFHERSVRLFFKWLQQAVFMVKKFLGNPALRTDRCAAFLLAVQGSAIHDLPVPNVDRHAATNPALAAQRVDNAILNDCTDLHWQKTFALNE